MHELEGTARLSSAKGSANLPSPLLATTDWRVHQKPASATQQLPMQNLIKIDKARINPSYPCPSVQSMVKKNSSKSADSPYDRRATSSSPAPGSSPATTTAPLPLHFSVSAFQRLSMMFKQQSKSGQKAISKLMKEMDAGRKTGPSKLASDL